MKVYLLVEADTGRVLSMHHEVDADGRDVACTEGDVLATLPPGVDHDRVTVLSTQLEAMPSGRDAEFDVDLQRRVVTLRPVRRRGAARDVEETE